MHESMLNTAFSVGVGAVTHALPLFFSQTPRLQLVVEDVVFVLGALPVMAHALICFYHLNLIKFKLTMSYNILSFLDQQISVEFLYNSINLEFTWLKFNGVLIFPFQPPTLFSCLIE
jgi:hypothetical protein